MAVIEATSETFSSLVLEADHPVIVDFWAAWCGPCTRVAPELERLAAKYEGKLNVIKVDVDANPALAQSFGVLSIPTIAYFAPGSDPRAVTGFRPAEDLERTFGLGSL